MVAPGRLAAAAQRWTRFALATLTRDAPPLPPPLPFRQGVPAGCDSKPDGRLRRRGRFSQSFPLPDMITRRALSEVTSRLLWSAKRRQAGGATGRENWRRETTVQNGQERKNEKRGERQRGWADRAWAPAGLLGRRPASGAAALASSRRLRPYDSLGVLARRVAFAAHKSADELVVVVQAFAVGERGVLRAAGHEAGKRVGLFGQDDPCAKVEKMLLALYSASRGACCHDGRYALAWEVRTMRVGDCGWDTRRCAVAAAHRAQRTHLVNQQTQCRRGVLVAAFGHHGVVAHRPKNLPVKDDGHLPWEGGRLVGRREPRSAALRMVRQQGEAEQFFFFFGDQRRRPHAPWECSLGEIPPATPCSAQCSCTVEVCGEGGGGREDVGGRKKHGEQFGRGDDNATSEPARSAGCRPLPPAINTPFWVARHVHLPTSFVAVVADNLVVMDNLGKRMRFSASVKERGTQGPSETPNQPRCPRPGRGPQ